MVSSRVRSENQKTAEIHFIVTESRKTAETLLRRRQELARNLRAYKKEALRKKLIDAGAKSVQAKQRREAAAADLQARAAAEEERKRDATARREERIAAIRARTLEHEERRETVAQRRKEK